MSIEQSAEALTDFYQYACGNWIKDNPVPEHQVRWVRCHEARQRSGKEVWRFLCGVP
jgi:putative endopeptidase